MEIIYALTWRIAVTALFGTLCEYLLPKSALRSAAVRAVSLVSLAILAEPILAAIGGK